MRLTILILALGFCAGCGDDADDDAGGWANGCGCAEGDSGGRTTFTPDKGTATVKGVVTFEGEAPPRRPVDLGSEDVCIQYYEDREPLRSEAYVVGAGGGLANVFVQVKTGLRDWTFPKASGEVLLDQVGCRYTPHVVGMRAGQTLVARNGDPVMHNVHGFWAHNDREVMNWAQAKKGHEDRKQMRKPGIIRVTCNMHTWMVAYVCIARYPFFAVTDEAGAFTLPKLPAGTYTLEAWHEKLGKKTTTVTVADGGTLDVNFTFAK
ncbi:MAG: carboxypeptidase regulatory-like domain-containing protein [Planctomycetota bacterium]|nr:carboxypeptidase regulatory-like domain-containing protein [Planctomycetota bacterium]